MGRLAFLEERDTDGNEGVVVVGDEAVEEGATEALDSRRGPCKPGFGDAEDFIISVLLWR